MESAFPALVVVVTAIAAVIAIVTLVGSARSYRQIGGGLTHDRDGSAATPASEREEEVRQLLGARNARRERRGEPPLDVDAEVERRMRELT